MIVDIIGNLLPQGRLGNMYFHGSRKSNKLALSFDDGPSTMTHSIYEVLRRNKCVATFFVVGNRVKAHRKLIKEGHALGCEFGNHSYDHSVLSLKSRTFVEEQLKSTNVELERITKRPNDLFRPPYGKIDLNVLSVAKSMGLKTILWDVDPKDWTLSGSQSLVGYCLNYCKHGSIIDLHDHSRRGNLAKSYAESLDVLIKYYKNRGFTFVNVSQLL
jgi:peptidoglycan/xylan/chitin deacetylase (PgdA/CDA1 family)